MSFYVLNNPRFFKGEYCYGQQKEVNFKTGSASFCEVCGSALTPLEWLSPVEASISRGALGDLIFGTYAGFICSEQFKLKYEEASLKGIADFKIASLYKGKTEVKVSYYYPDITTVRAFVDLSLLEFNKMDFCEACQKGRSVLDKINGIIFLHPELIEKDIFFTSALGASYIIVSSRFKSFCEVVGITNCSFTEASVFRSNY